MKLLVSKRSRKPSAFAPAVGVKNAPPGTPHSTSTTTPTPPTSTPSRKTLSPSVKSAIVHFLSGGLAAGIVRASLQPLDTCKTRLQASRHATRTLSSLTNLLFADGPRALYRGVVPGVAGIVPAAAVYMLTFQTLRARLGERFPARRNDLVIATAAALGDVAASLVRVPCEVLKQRLQVAVYPNVVAALSSISKSGGIARLYSGLTAQLVRDVPYAAAEFVVYENLKVAALRRRRHVASGGDAVSTPSIELEKLHRTDGLVVGAIAGAIAAIVSNPADVIKTRLMTQVHSGQALSAAAVPYRGVRDAALRIVREEGPAAFAKGISPRIAAKALQSGMFFAVYEALRRGISSSLGVEREAAASGSH